MLSTGKCVAISAIFALLLLIMLPLRPVLQAPGGLTITATGERNPLAKSTEVWLSTSLADAIRDSATRFDSGWERRDGSLVSFRNQPATIQSNIQVEPGASLIFTKHDYSGIVEIRSGDFVQRYDLYSVTPGALKIDLSELSVGRTILKGALIYAGAFAAFLAAVLFLARMPRAGAPAAAGENEAPRLSLWFAAPSILIYSFVLAAYWPAQMSPDSIDQWRQIVEGHYGDAHPVMSTILYQLAYLVYPAPQTPAIFQIIAYAAVTWFFLREAKAWGAPTYVIAIAAVLFPLFPANFMLVTTLWKDVPFTIGIILLSTLAAREVRRGLTLAWGSVIAMSMAGILTFGVRHNGIVIVVLFFALLFLFAKGRGRKLRVGAALVAQLGVFLILKTLLLSALGAYPMPAHYRSIFALHVLGAMETAGVQFEGADKTLMEKVLPREEWVQGYDCRSVVPLFWNKHISYKELSTSTGDLNALMFKEIMRHPQVFLRHQLCVTGLIWRIGGGNNEFVAISPAGITNMPEGKALGLATRSMLPEAKQTLDTWHSQIFAKSGVYTRPALYVLLGLLAILMVMYRSVPAAALIFAPALFNCLGLGILMSAQDYRYLWPSVVLSLLVIVLAIGMAAAGARAGEISYRAK
ncbi:hypothetical protein ACFWP0_01280 [Achromobacter sp. NPDC058515]|uniref:hypothetical protein n=1 Tax=Achromobacter sp. NPDC058515 TaxID=3346533 RepID=UPI0036476029